MSVDIIENRKTIIMAITDAGGIGPKMFQQLLMRLGAPEDFLSASYSDFEDIPRLSSERIRKLMDSLTRVEEYESKFNEYSSLNINVATFLDSDYPEQLREISDPPPIIYFRGDREAFSDKYIALVGTSIPSQEGLRLAVDLSKEFVRSGFGIVSGLAAGIDSAAHLGVLKENGRTIGILGSGVLNIYPDENIPLAENILQNGIILSEYSPFTKVCRQNLVLRNRLISALSCAVIVVQIGDNTPGELKTAAYAVKQGKPLFYGNPDGRMDHSKIENMPDLIINSVESVKEIIKYIV